MKLQDLYERISAPVHINDEKTLVVISSLLQKEFGLKFDKIGGACLASQVIFSILHAVPGLKAQDLVDELNKTDIESNYRGVTLQELFDFFDQPIKLSDGRVLTYKLSASVHTATEAMKEIKLGIPVICIPSDRVYMYVDSPSDEDGIVDEFNSKMLQNANVHKNNTSHAYLMIGYDEKHFIWRDMRSVYAFKGYVKIPYKVLIQYPNAVHYMTVNVDDVKITQPKK